MERLIAILLFPFYLPRCHSLFEPTRVAFRLARPDVFRSFSFPPDARGNNLRGSNPRVPNESLQTKRSVSDEIDLSRVIAIPVGISIVDPVDEKPWGSC